MKKKVAVLGLMVVFAAAALLFVGCPSDGDGSGGGYSYIDDWEYIDLSEGVDGVLDDGDMRQVFTIAASNWQMMMYERSGGAWVSSLGFQGTYTATTDTWTVTLTGLSFPPLYGGTWFGATEWQDYDNYYYMYMVYYYYWYYTTGGATQDIGYDFSADGNTLYMDVDGDVTAFTRI
jgi:hypothetical protein